MPSVQKGYEPAIYRIDLSLPPAARYVEVAIAHSSKVAKLTSLFDGLVAELLPTVPVSYVHTFARIFLRRLYTDEETAEIRGISEAINIPMYLLVSFNVLLDLLMGCTSGGVRVRDGRGSKQIMRMLHFRTLDWGMDPLREVLVQLEFVRSKSAEPEKVLVSTITYVGFVGVLTGVRDGLSLSLNFRPVHAATTRKQNFSFYWNHFLVLTGRRRSLPSTLRSYLFPEPLDAKNSPPANGANSQHQTSYPSITAVLKRLPYIHSTAAYLIFCTGKETHILEKDNGTALIRSSTSFIANTNHDTSHETNLDYTKNNTLSSSSPDHTVNPEASHAAAPTWESSERSPNIGFPPTLAETIEESIDRLACLTFRWKSLALETPEAEQENLSITKSDLVKWLTAFPTTNECTHFGCIMDPGDTGKILWVRGYKEGEVNGKGGKVRERLRRQREKEQQSITL